MPDYSYLAELSGTKQEQEWLRERLETLSVREMTILEAAVQYVQPQNAKDAVNCLQSLDSYIVRVNVGSEEQLGSAYLRNETAMPEEAAQCVHLNRAGRQYREKHPGVFVQNCYVEFPEYGLVDTYIPPGRSLPKDDKWSIKLKLASPDVPEGVWLRLPSSSNWDDTNFQDETLALQSLCAQSLDECTVLDIRCILPQMENLMDQYDHISELICDGQDLGVTLYQMRNTTPHFMERYYAALDLENCHTLELALDISQNLHCYDWVSIDGLEEFAAKHLRAGGVSENVVNSSAIDLDRYAVKLLDQMGYQPTADGRGHILRNSQQFHYCYSTPTPEQSGMMMQ